MLLMNTNDYDIWIDALCDGVVMNVLLVLVLASTFAFVVLTLIQDGEYWQLAANGQGGCILVFAILAIVLLSIYSIRTLQNLLPKQPKKNNVNVHPINTATINFSSASSAGVTATAAPLVSATLPSPPPIPAMAVSTATTTVVVVIADTESQSNTRRFIRVIRVAQLLGALSCAVVIGVISMSSLTLSNIYTILIEVVYVLFDISEI
jgi:hypothetical protein